MAKITTYPLNYSGKNIKIGIVRARFSEGLGDRLADGALRELKALGVKAGNITLVTVPGALEIPVTLQKLLTEEDFDAMIAIGVVIRGETYHFEVVSNTMAEGIAEISLDFGVPIANAVLTVYSEKEAIARLGKGREAARVAVEMANHFKAIGGAK